MYRKALLASFAIILFLLVPVHAAPSLSLGGTAKYNVSAILHISSGCTADPLQYAGDACNPVVYYPGPYPVNFNYTQPGPFPIRTGSVSISIFDSGHCSLTLPSNMSCGFNPSSQVIYQGQSVTWINNATRSHRVRSLMNVTGTSTPLFDSGDLMQGQNYTYTFSTPGSYAYHDSWYYSMQGTIVVESYVCACSYFVPTPIRPPPQPTNIQAEVDGTVSWTIVGLDNTSAVLKVDHDLSLSVSPLPSITVTPVHESGSFEQSIELNTRLESPGTASSIISHVLGQFLNGLPGLTTGQYYGTGTYYGTPSLNLPFASQLSGSQKMYTIWWVNGPLVPGSPVKILSGLASVTGDESVTVDPFGPKQAWLVTSNVTETVKTSIPYISDNQVTSSLKMSWAFDKTNDLLLKSEINGLFASHSTTKQTIWPNPCVYPYLTPGTICPVCYSCQSAIQVNVSRDSEVTLAVGMTLTSTSLGSGSGRMPNLASNSDPAPLPMMALLSIGSIGAVAAAGVGGGVWFMQRRRAKTSSLPQSPV